MPTICHLSLGGSRWVSGLDLPHCTLGLILNLKSSGQGYRSGFLGATRKNTPIPRMKCPSQDLFCPAHLWGLLSLLCHLLSLLWATRDVTAAQAGVHHRPPGVTFLVPTPNPPPGSAEPPAPSQPGGRHRWGCIPRTCQGHLTALGGGREAGWER